MVKGILYMLIWLCCCTNCCFGFFVPNCHNKNVISLSLLFFCTYKFFAVALFCFFYLLDSLPLVLSRHFTQFVKWSRHRFSYPLLPLSFLSLYVPICGNGGPLIHQINCDLILRSSRYATIKIIYQMMKRTENRTEHFKIYHSYFL